MTTLYTVGHGARSAEELVDVLLRAGIGCVVDVRRFPGSRRHPQFGRDALAATLSANGIDYDWRGEELGGRRDAAGFSRHTAWRNAGLRAFADYMDTVLFRDALARLESDAERSRPLAIMCAETRWWRCHRRLIADALTLRGRYVVHLIKPGETQPHILHPEVRPDDEGWPLYSG